MSEIESQIINRGQALAQKLLTTAKRLVDVDGLDSALIDNAEDLLQQMENNNRAHNNWVDRSDRT